MKFSYFGLIFASNLLLVASSKGKQCANGGTEAALKLMLEDSSFLSSAFPCNEVNALWLRTLFHDCGPYDPVTKQGGCDGSLAMEWGRSENAGLLATLMVYASESGATGLTIADIIVNCAVLAIQICGGPSLPFTYGRVDAKVASETGRMPNPFMNASEILSFGDRFGMSLCEKVAVYVGSHTLGGVNVANNPNVFSDHTPTPLKVPSSGFLPFTTNSNKFDNSIWSAVLKGQSPLFSDNNIIKNNQALICVRQFAASKSTFFKIYSSGLQRMIFRGSSSCVKIASDIHFPKGVRGSGEESSTIIPCPTGDERDMSPCIRPDFDGANPGVCITKNCLAQCQRGSWTYQNLDANVKCVNNANGEATIELVRSNSSNYRVKRSVEKFDDSNLINLNESPEDVVRRLSRSPQEELDEIAELVHDEL